MRVPVRAMCRRDAAGLRGKTLFICNATSITLGKESRRVPCDRCFPSPTKKSYRLLSPIKNMNEMARNLGIEVRTPCNASLARIVRRVCCTIVDGMQRGKRLLNPLRASAAANGARHEYKVRIHCRRKPQRRRRFGNAWQRSCEFQSILSHY